MLDVLVQLALFSAKAIILVVLILILLAGIIALLTKGKDKIAGKISIKNLNKKYKETQETLLEEILEKDQFKKFLKHKKTTEKADKKSADTSKQRIFVLNFCGDIKASAVNALREEVTALLSIATPQDEVVVRLESGGGMVHGYGLAAAQLSRITQQHIPLTVTVDKVAASGGYLMAAIANKILAAPFAIIGSIGVIVQIPNFHRLLKEKHIDFEQLTAGNFKRTLTMFGQNTEEGREKLLEELQEVHHLFKQTIIEHRPQLDLEKIATGEHWMGSRAYELKLVDEIKTSDDYLLEKSKTAHLYEVTYQTKKSLGSKLASAMNLFHQGDFASRTMM